MEFRRHVLGGHGAVAVVITAAAWTAVMALQTSATRANDAYAQVVANLALVDRVRDQATDLTDTIRAYLAERTDQRHAAVGLALERVDPTIDRLVARATEIEMPDAWRLAQDADAYVGWLSAATAAGLSVDAFERLRGGRRAALDAELDGFAAAARSQADNQIATANALARRAQFGVLFTSAIAIVVGFVLAGNLLRKLGAHLKRLRVATNSANRSAVARRDLLDIAVAELRSSLNTVRLNLELLEDGHRDARSRAPSRHIGATCKRMDELLDNLAESSDLDAADAIDLHHEDVNTRTLIETCIDLFLSRAKAEGVRLKTDSRDILTVRADRERLVQVFANLISHSIGRAGRDGMVTISAAPHDAGVRFAVTDSGETIAPEQRSRLFDRHTSQRRSRGAGLALYVCRRLVEAHGGQIGVDVDSAGTTFWFVIPN
jgi:signal transduction histidine kinase